MEIEFFGEGKIRIVKGQSILQASFAAGIPHFHACGGRAKCSTCRVMVLDGARNLSAINEREAHLKSIRTIPSDVRLACQTKVNEGSVKLLRVIKDELDVSLLIKADSFTQCNVRQSQGHEKYLVLFFLDIRDFTPFVESSLPFDVIHVLRRLFLIFYSAIKKFNGVLIETAGDGLYAIFGNHGSIEEASDSAIAAGLTILETLDDFNKTYLVPYFQVQLKVGLAIHSGKVIVGEFNLGEIKKKSSMGLAVNIASRLQEFTKVLDNDFLASEEVIKHSRYSIELKKITVTLRGISNPVTICLLGRRYSEYSILSI